MPGSILLKIIYKHIRTNEAVHAGVYSMFIYNTHMSMNMCVLKVVMEKGD